MLYGSVHYIHFLPVFIVEYKVVEHFIKIVRPAFDAKVQGLPQRG